MALTTESALRKDRTSAQGATMEHRHFAFIANVLRDVPPKQRKAIVERFAQACAGSNPRFDRERFLTACDYYKL